MRPFRSDGCTWWPDGVYWQCCRLHDRAYHTGGCYRDRLLADADLLACVAGQGRPLTAIVMYAGVRLFGAFLWPLPWRWGYGYRWPRCRCEEDGA